MRAPTNSADKPQLAEVWVDQNAPAGVPLGTEIAPFDTLLEGHAATADSGTLKLRGDTGAPDFDETFTGVDTLDRPMRIEAHGGAVRIGATP